MSAAPSTAPGVRARYLHGDETGPFLAMLHVAQGEHERDKAVLFCPPFGWEELCSYRRRREWAQALAEAGFATLRIDLPGTGDSADSPLSPERVRAWREAIRASAEWLVATTGARSVAGVGIGLGGLLLCEAIAAGAEIDEVVLWAAPSRGASFVRELRAFGRLEAATSMPEGAEDIKDERVGANAGGFVLSRETMTALQELDATHLELPAGRPRRALLLERDGLPVDGPLREHLEAYGAIVDVRAGEGYAEMMAPPHEGRTPHEVIAATSEWLAADVPAAHANGGPPRREPARARAVRESYAIELTPERAAVRESPMRVPQSFGALFGILAQPVDVPAAPVTAVLLNAGAHRRVGQGRMWVEAARRWAAAGVPTLRLDLEGIGDADGDAARFTDMGELYDERLVTQVLAALDALDARGLGPTYVAAGLCAGAYWSFHMALRDPRVAAALMINPQATFWDRSLKTARMIRHGSKRKLLRGEVELAQLRKLARGLPAFAAARVRARLGKRGGASELDRALDKLHADEKHVRLMFSGGEPLRAELEAEGWPHAAARWPNVSFSVIPGADHVLRPLVAQRYVHDALDRALEAELGRPLDEAGDEGSALRQESGAREAGVLQVVRIMSTEQGA